MSEPESDPGAPLEVRLAPLRQAIDEVDAQIVRLLDRRARLVRQVGEAKAAEAAEVYAPARESQVLKRVVELGQGDFPATGLEAVFKEIISSARGLEAGIRVAYLGAEASLAHLAARSVFGASALMVPQTTGQGVFDQILAGSADYGVLPAEMAEDGAIVHVMERLWDQGLKVCRTAEVALSQHLLSRAGKLEAVERVYASPAALAGAEAWLHVTLPAVSLIEVETAAEAVRRAAQDAGSAALGPAGLGEEASLPVLVPNVEGKREEARFYVIGQAGSARTGHDRCLFAFKLADQTGSLREALGVFAEHGVDLRFLEARSPRGREVVVFGELSGHPEDPQVAAALEELARSGREVRLLGSYPEFTLAS